MKVLMIGTGSGSWTVRGQQLGQAIGARVTTAPSVTDLHWADVAVLVKRATAWAPALRRIGTPIVWDALDFWQQPEENTLTANEAILNLKMRAKACAAALVIGATGAMAADVGGVYLPHHARPGLTLTAARPTVRTVAYEGTKKYLGRWARWVQGECDRRGWRFLINPTDLREADLLVAFRDGLHDGWMCRQWKSGVKVVNATAIGRPIIGQDCAAMRELRPDAYLLEDPSHLSEAFDACSDRALRDAVVVRSATRQLECSLPMVAAQFQAILSGVREKVA